MMKLSLIPGTYETILLNMSEFKADLTRVDCSVCPCEYLIWILVELGFPTVTPPWMEEPILDFKSRVTRRYHVTEVHGFLCKVLKDNGYNGQELIVCTQGQAYCSISFIKE